MSSKPQPKKPTQKPASSKKPKARGAQDRFPSAATPKPKPRKKS